MNVNTVLSINGENNSEVIDTQISPAPASDTSTEERRISPVQLGDAVHLSANNDEENAIGNGKPLSARDVIETQFMHTESFPYANDDERLKVFAQGLFPEQIPQQQLKGWQTMRGVEYSILALNNFINAKSDNLGDEEKRAIDAAIEGLKKVQKYMRLNNGFVKSFVVAKELLDKNSPRDLWCTLDIDRIELEKFLDSFDKDAEDVDEDYDLKLDRIARFLATVKGSPYYLGDTLNEITNELNDGHCVYLSSGWSKIDGHCAYIFLEKIGENIYAHEINAGGGIDTKLVENCKFSIYEKRCTPGCTIQLNKEDVLDFIIANCRLQCYEEDLKKATKDYQELWKKGKPIREQSKYGRPNFTQPLQRGSNCVTYSTNILIRTILHKVMANKNVSEAEAKGKSRVTTK